MASSKSIPAVEPLQLDPAQRQAIEHVHGPLLVVAGAGTGKTTVLIQRIARLIGDGHARPDEVLALTYTDNAASEMQERVHSALRSKTAGLRIETFHAFCNNLLIRNRQAFGVLDDFDLWIYLRKRIRELALQHFIIPANIGKFLHDLLDFMRRCHDELIEPAGYANYVARLERGELPIPRVAKSKDAALLTDDEVLARCQEIARVFTLVESMLAQENLGTFGHMITRAHQLLSSDSGLLSHERSRARFILVDEFQDANLAQVKILRLLAGDERNIFAVGDPDQAIYRFRGASSAAFTLFQRTFPETQIVALDRNRRSTTPILKCAHGVIVKNPGISTDRRSPLLSARDEEAPTDVKSRTNPVELVILGAKEKDIECSDVITVIQEQRRRSRCGWKNIAVLCRQHSHRDELVQELQARGIPFSIDNMDVMDTAESRDLFACLSAVVSTADDASLLRVAALPQFSIDPQKLRAAIRALPREQKIGRVATALPKIEGGTVVLDTLRFVREQINATDAKATAAVQLIVRQFKLNPASPPLKAVLDFVDRWEKKPIVKTGEIAELLEYLEYFREANGAIPLPATDANAIHLMTAHSAKGLEFDHVIILRASSPSFPSSYKEPLVEFPRALRDDDAVGNEDEKTLHEQEERRLFYVAMTRARDSLTIYAKKGTGKTDPTPPGYLRELIKDRNLDAHLRQRPARGFQTEIFAAAAPQPVGVSAWTALPPTADLSSRLSASAVQTYETCPLQFKLDRDWKIPGEPGAPMQYGASMHRVLLAFYQSVMQGQVMSQDDLLALFREDLVSEKIQDPYQHDLYRQQGIEQLKEFYAASSRGSVPNVMHTEEHFEVKVGPTIVAGRIDRMDRLPDGSVVITDYKTGRPKSQEDADDSLQLSIYALAAKEKWGYRADHLVFYNLQENSSVATTRSDAQLQDARMRVEEVAQSIAEGKFDPKPNFTSCRLCAYRSLCPVTEKRFAVEPA